MPETVYTLIADALRRDIDAGVLRPGDDVPSESALCATWSTSRGPVRNALAALRAEGLVETRRGRPATVLARGPDRAVAAHASFTAWAREGGRTPGARTEQLALRRADEAQALALHLEPGTRIVELVRLRLLDGAPVVLQRAAFVEPVGRLLFDADLDAGSLTEHLAAHGHRAAGARHEIDAVAADELDARLLGVAPGAPLLRRRRTSTDADGLPFASSDDRHRTDAVRFTVDAAARLEAPTRAGTPPHPLPAADAPPGRAPADHREDR